LTASNLTPEQQARVIIDAALEASGWAVQNRDEANLAASQGVAVREFRLKSGPVDYLLFVDGRAVGVLEAKAVGHPLSGVEVQAEQYGEGLPETLDTPVRPLPFQYVSTGAKTRFTNLLDPEPRSRRVFQIHRPATLAEWLAADPLRDWVEAQGPVQVADRPPLPADRPSSLRARIRTMPPLHTGFLYPNQVRAITNLEQSLAADRPRSLIQMATGSGKTLMAITALYRLIKFGGARRVLFLVDRTNLGEQAEKEFQLFRSPDDNRKFTELYNVQRLAGNTVGSSTKVVISTIQRLYSMLTGTEIDPADEEGSQFESGGPAGKEPLPVVYNPAVPPEFFDVIVVDECHRSIYSVWGQVLEYFDAHLIGLTATPAKHTYGYFGQNLVMEYGHEEAVTDGVNVDFEVYKIRTRISEEGSVIDASTEPVVGKRDTRTREVRWEAPDEPIAYEAGKLDRAVVAPDQIRTILRTFRNRVCTEIFPGRAHVPKTLIFAKSDSHAEDIVKITREEFGKGNDFCRKITYKVTGKKPADLIQEFRTSYNPRIAVTVDLVATGTDIRPIEVVMFMRSVKSRVLFEQMKGRGVRIIDRDELRGVTPDAPAKTHFVIVDCVGITESDLSDTQPLERRKTVPLNKLLEHVAFGGTDPDTLSSLASRLSRLHKQATEEQREELREVGEGVDITAVSHAIVAALSPDRQVEEARRAHAIPADEEPTAPQLEAAAKTLLKQAAEPLATKPKLRKAIEELRQQLEQTIDIVSRDELLEAGVSPEAKLKAKALVKSFEQFLDEHKDEIDALHFFYSQPYRERLKFEDLKKLAAEIGKPPRSWTPDKLWHAYELLEKDKVRGAAAGRLLTDIVSLVRFALHQRDELAPYAAQVHERFDHWLEQQRQQGREFGPEQLRWLEMMRDHVASSLAIEIDDFDEVPFAQEGGLGKARQVFGDALGSIIQELNEELAA
jgi:type I restriction enzyme R subunit